MRLNEIYHTTAVILATLTLGSVAHAEISIPSGPVPGLVINTPYGPAIGAGFGLVQDPIPGLIIHTPYGIAVGTGFNVPGGVVHGGGMLPGATQGVSGVECAFGEEALVAASVDSCENAGGAVTPSQLSYTVKCTIGEDMVMTPSSSSCARLGGELVSVE